MNFATTCPPDRRTGCSESAVRPPNGCTVRRLASTSGRVAVIRTSTPARRTALAITFMSSVSTAEAATNTHSAPEAARMSERSSIDPRPGNPRSTPTSLVATTPMGRNPNAGLDNGLPSTQLRILLAEDNIVNQRLASRLLEKRGHRVALASTGGEALARLKDETFDVILMDVQMPDMDGLETTAIIRDAKRRVAHGRRLSRLRRTQ